MAHWISRVPPHQTLPANQNLNGSIKNLQSISFSSYNLRFLEIILLIHNHRKLFSHYLNKNFLEAQLIKNLIFFIWCILSDRMKRLWQILTRGRGETPSLIRLVRKRLWSYVIYSDKLKIVQIWLKNYFSIQETSY